MNQNEKRIVWIATIFLLVSFATRVALGIFSSESYSAPEWIRFISVGFLYDFAVMACVVLPWTVYEA
ncbi:MAG: hypothetical protein ACKVKG_18890, partial [Alphaproteobacteria bacterium]